MRVHKEKNAFYIREANKVIDDSTFGLMDMDITLREDVEYIRYSKDKESLEKWLNEKRNNFLREDGDR